LRRSARRRDARFPRPRARWSASNTPTTSPRRVRRSARKASTFARETAPSSKNAASTSSAQPGVKGSGEVERSCYCIHAPIHRLAPHAACVLHTHMPFASALSRLEDPRIKPIGQTEVGMIRHIAYDDIYTGLAFDPAEGERLAGVLGDKTILFMANHGVTVVGKTVAEAYDRLYYLERAAQVQLYAMWTGQPLKEIPAATVEHMTEQYKSGVKYEVSPAQRHFDALKRMLDRQEPDYRD